MKMNVNDRRNYVYAAWATAKERSEKFRLERNSNPDLGDAGALLDQLSGQLSAGYSPLSHGGYIVPGDQKSFVLPR